MKSAGWNCSTCEVVTASDEPQPAPSPCASAVVFSLKVCAEGQNRIRMCNAHVHFDRALNFPSSAPLGRGFFIDPREPKKIQPPL
jgi:hypothetical protein